MHPLLKIVITRIVYGAVTLWAVSTFIFFIIAALPGDFAEIALGRDASPDAIANFRQSLHLDDPILSRYVAWIHGVLHGDFGHSFSSGREISDIILFRFGNTLFLAALAAVITISVSLTFGILAAIYRGGYFDRVINAVTLISMSVPDFFVCYVLVIIFATQLPIFPSISYVDASTPLWERIYRCALPAFALSLVSTAHLMRMTRAALIDVLASSYIETAVLKGMTRRRIVLWHAFPNALAPIITIVMFNLAWLVVGVVIVEVVFAYPGLGQVLVDSVAKRDIPLVQASTLIFAAVYIVLNSLADVISVLSNPRLLYNR